MSSRGQGHVFCARRPRFASRSTSRPRRRRISPASNSLAPAFRTVDNDAGERARSALMLSNIRGLSFALHAPSAGVTWRVSTCGHMAAPKPKAADMESMTALQILIPRAHALLAAVAAKYICFGRKCQKLTQNFRLFRWTNCRVFVCFHTHSGFERHFFDLFPRSRSPCNFSPPPQGACPCAGICSLFTAFIACAEIVHRPAVCCPVGRRLRNRLCAIYPICQV